VGDFVVPAAKPVQTGLTKVTFIPEVPVSAFIVIDRLVVSDPAAFAAYHPMALQAVGLYGGRFVLPSQIEVAPLEGNWRPDRIVVIEFADSERAQQWWSSDEYAEARKLHAQATISNVVLLVGLEEQPPS
jgi:uncharacterized protein (DUF1330 family)